MVVLGRSMWVQALCQLVEVEDCCVFLDECMASINLMPVRVNCCSAGDRFHKDMMDGSDRLWGKYNVWSSQVNYV